MSYMPKHLPPESKWPTIVMETGYANSKRKLDLNARWWLNESEGEVKMVFVTFYSASEEGMFAPEMGTC